MGNAEPFKSSIQVSPLRASPTPVYTYVGLTRCSEASHLWKLLQECGLASRSLSVAIAVFLSRSPMRLAHQNGADTLTSCDLNWLCRQRPHQKNFFTGLYTLKGWPWHYLYLYHRDMVGSKTDTILVPMAVIVINTNQMRTRKNKRFVRLIQGHVLLYEVGIIISFTLQMRKLRHKDVEVLPNGIL